MSAIAVMLVVGSLLVGCGSDDSDTPEAASATPKDTSSQRPASIVGRWQLQQSCEGMVKSLDQAGLRAIAPSIVGDFFPDQTPKQLARKGDVCQGAEPRQHSHFFTTDGEFGSLDQNGQQVDGQPYRVIDGQTLRINSEFGAENYRYRIDAGDRLTLVPVIPPGAKRAARANALNDPGIAGHMAAVAYAGHTWKRVECEGWC